MPQISVDWAMRYGKPSIAERIAELARAGCERLLLFPLYPQYSAATTATVNDKAFDALKTMRWQPALRTVPPYHDEPVYIDALAESIGKHLASLDFEPEVTLASYHGLPKSYFEKGDPYSLPLPEDVPSTPGEAGLVRGEAHHDVPVAVRT